MVQALRWKADVCLHKGEIRSSPLETTVKPQKSLKGDDQHTSQRGTVGNAAPPMQYPELSKHMLVWLPLLWTCSVSYLYLKIFKHLCVGLTWSQDRESRIQREEDQLHGEAAQSSTPQTLRSRPVLAPDAADAAG